MKGVIKKDSDPTKLDLSAGRARVNHAKRVVERLKKKSDTDKDLQKDQKRSIDELQEVITVFSKSTDVALKDFATKEVKVGTLLGTALVSALCGHSFFWSCLSLSFSSITASARETQELRLT